MDRLLERNAVSESQVREVAEIMAAFHARQSMPPGSAEETVSRQGDAIMENFESAEEFAGDVLDAELLRAVKQRALAEFERSLISERTRAGMKAVKARGGSVGRPKSLTGAQIAHARELLANGDSAASVARLFGVSRPTIYRALKGR